MRHMPRAIAVLLLISPRACDASEGKAPYRYSYWYSESEGGDAYEGGDEGDATVPYEDEHIWYNYLSYTYYTYNYEPYEPWYNYESPTHWIYRAEESGNPPPRSSARVGCTADGITLRVYARGGCSGEAVDTITAAFGECGHAVQNYILRDNERVPGNLGLCPGMFCAGDLYGPQPLSSTAVGCADGVAVVHSFATDDCTGEVSHVEDLGMPASDECLDSFLPLLREEGSRGFLSLLLHLLKGHYAPFASPAALREAVAEWVANEGVVEARRGPPSGWDVSRVDDMSELFSSKSDIYHGTNDYFFLDSMRRAITLNEAIGGWDTSKVTRMDRTFDAAAGFNALLAWDTSKVTSMNGTFNSAKAFNQPLAWDTSQVTTMEWAFNIADAFNSELVWDTSQVTNMNYMFADATSFNQRGIAAWDVSRVGHFDLTFSHERSGYSAIESDACTKQVIAEAWANKNEAFTTWAGTLSCVFWPHISWRYSLANAVSEWYANPGNYEPISVWDTSRVTRMGSTFASAKAFNEPLDWDTSKVDSIDSTFRGAEAFNQVLSWDTSKVTNMYATFYYSDNFNQPLV